jgi:methyl-accepting chemotaxis protein
MDYDALKVWVDVAQFVLLAAVGAWSWLAQRNDETRAAVADHAERLSAIEARVTKMPDHDDLSKLWTEMNETRAAVERVIGELTQISKQLSMISEYLLNQSK